MSVASSAKSGGRVEPSATGKDHDVGSAGAFERIGRGRLAVTIVAVRQAGPAPVAPSPAARRRSRWMMASCRPVVPNASSRSARRAARARSVDERRHDFDLGTDRDDHRLVLRPELAEKVARGGLGERQAASRHAEAAIDARWRPTAGTPRPRSSRSAEVRRSPAARNPACGQPGHGSPRASVTLA